jgi:hypothetical protein
MGDGEPSSEQYEPFCRAVTEILRKRGLSPEETICFHTIDYARIGLDAQQRVYTRAFPHLEGKRPTFWNPIGFARHFMTFYIGDVVIYSSPEGENLIRAYVFNELDGIIRDHSATFSVVAHSLGSVIAYDYLYNVFGKEESKRRRVREDHRQQLRHFFTFGSPIGLFLLRRTDLFGDGTNDNSPARLLSNPIGLNRETGRWLNFYDNQDILACPLKNFFPGIVEDVNVQTGNLVYNSHVKYWRSREMVQKIVRCIMSMS